jgi:hypothetical protein
VLHCRVLALAQVRSLRMPSDVIRDVLEGVLLVMGQVRGRSQYVECNAQYVESSLTASCMMLQHQELHTILKAQQGRFSVNFSF